MFLSLLTILLLASFLAKFLVKLPNVNVITAAVLVLLAISIHFNLFVHKPREKFEKMKTISNERFIQLLIMGFLIFFATAIDDTLVYSSLFLNGLTKKLLVSSGIIIAALLELYVIFHFSKIITKWKYKSEIASIGLIVLAVLVFFKII